MEKKQDWSISIRFIEVNDMITGSLVTVIQDIFHRNIDVALKRAV